MRTKAMDALDAARKYVEARAATYYQNKVLKRILKSAKGGECTFLIDVTFLPDLMIEKINVFLQIDGFKTTNRSHLTFGRKYIKVSCAGAYGGHNADSELTSCWS